MIQRLIKTCVSRSGAPHSASDLVIGIWGGELVGDEQSATAKFYGRCLTAGCTQNPQSVAPLP